VLQTTPTPRGPHFRPPVTYGPYTAHNPAKNWMIGGLAVVALVVALVLIAVLSVSNVNSLINAETQLPSSGSNTVAWYWSSQFNPPSRSGETLDVTNADFTTIATSNQDDDLAYFVALDSHGTAWMWGTPALVPLPGGLPIGNDPTAVAMPSGIHLRKVATNEGYVVAIDTTGRIWTWGHVNWALPPASTTTTTSTTVPTAVKPSELSTPPGVKFTSVSVGFDFALALDSSGHVWAWGNNDEGNLGLATPSAAVLTPTEVATPPGVTFSAVAAGTEQSVALDSQGQVWDWGLDEGSDLGVADSEVPAGPGSCRAITTGLCTSTPLAVAFPPGVRVTAIAAGDDESAALDSSGRIWTWGSSADGALGLGNTGTTSTPATVSAPGARFVAMALTLANDFGPDNMAALDSTGHVWAWGSNQLLHAKKGTSACLSADPNEPPSSWTAQCVMHPIALSPPPSAALKGVAATTSAIFGFTH
jgi:alpha-tubulin suppressor-like RCC1 family protein